MPGPTIGMFAAGTAAGPVTPAAAFSPTPYTTALMLQLRRRAAFICGRSVLELGTGSGVVLASMLQAGAARALGVELEAAAMATTAALLAQAGLSDRAELRQGDLWGPCAGQQFDVVATNLPHFPLLQPLPDGRLPSWSVGGPDGRALVDRFLQGLPQHLAPGGLALMTHNVFIDLAKTRAHLRPLGLRARIASTVSLPLDPLRLQGLPAPVRQAWLGRGVHLLAGHAWADFHVLEIRHLGAPHGG